MAKLWRVMRNRLGYGTSCVEDHIPNETLANHIAAKCELKPEEEGDTFFIQEYEESRGIYGGLGDPAPQRT